MKLNDWFRGKRGNNNQGGNNQGEDVEYYEDTHDEFGNYIGPRKATRQEEYPRQGVKASQDYQNPKQDEQPISTGKYGNIAVYRPVNLADVERLIAFLRRGEPAVINLNEVDEDDAQRILDYLSGAIYALSGSVHRITDNIFLLSPSGVEVQATN